jgi:hypothetical protein
MKITGLFYPTQQSNLTDFHDADIVLYKPSSELTQNGINQVMAHEMWHLIEQEKGISLQHPIIIEGTATYVQKRLFGEKILPQKNTDFTKWLYLDSAYITQEVVADSENPFRSLLEDKVRSEIDNKITDDLKSRLEKLTRSSWEIPGAKEEMLQKALKVPELAVLKGNLSKENLLEAYRKLGATTLAKELRHQNVENLIEEMKLIGF